MGHLWLERSLLIVTLLSLLAPGSGGYIETMRKDREEALLVIHDVATENMGALCVTEPYRSLKVPLATSQYEGAQQKADMAAMLLQDLGVSHRSGLMDALARSLLVSDRHVLTARVLALNASSSTLINSVSWQRQFVVTPTLMSGGLDHSLLFELGGPHRLQEDGLRTGFRPDPRYPWYENADTSPGLWSPKFMPSPTNMSFRGWWTFPYFSCSVRRWLLSYSVSIPPPTKHGVKGFLSLDIDVSGLEVNQCDLSSGPKLSNQIEVLRGTHKCHNDTTQCVFRPGLGWMRGGYQCVCRHGFYSLRQKGVFNGSLVEAAWLEHEQNVSSLYHQMFRCLKCAPGCETCHNNAPCLATYNWPFRISLLAVSVSCVAFTLGLVGYVYQHRKIKVFKVASPIFLCITLLGCAIMYLEMAAIFPVLDLYSCIATKWSRHLGFCITYTALLMKTWRVSLTYRVKSAHKVKLTDKQLLQWMFPILLVMLIYLGTWTLSAPPIAEQIRDQAGLRFKQCSYNWWDHSLAIGEVLFLSWGIKVCYNVRNAESLYNEARLISYAIYNIALVNTAMVAFHLFIFPQAGPDIKYLLGFIRTQLSTSVTVGLVFGPKVVRVLRGQGDQWDNRARARGVTASFSLNGIGLMPEETADLYQENEELKILHEQPSPCCQPKKTRNP
ncbi:probable G-protein coupled receptor CG31760 isoform X2 [Cryptotermes secundus]|uniref:probable G-protein coupled receptor CG31760 isoform X2 n=1 Tax=Cryptotermes secundus TaxID=105785 RepID=UPI001454D4A5|nr:probable G-protein coupled receptor CG31760 isoform X2 [Cryptotermes secundus]